MAELAAPERLPDLEVIDRPLLGRELLGLMSSLILHFGRLLLLFVLLGLGLLGVNKDRLVLVHNCLVVCWLSLVVGRHDLLLGHVHLGL
jgi:hypothetical protein